MNPDLLVESVRQFRAGEGPGTVNCNTNASRPEAVIRLAEAGLTSMPPLSGLEADVLLRKATEPPYTGKYVNNHAAGQHQNIRTLVEQVLCCGTASLRIGK